MLFDVVDLLDRDTAAFEALLGSTSARVLVVSRDLRPDLAARALSGGAHGSVSLGVSETELLEAVESSSRPDSDTADRDPPVRGTQLGGEAGLTQP